MTLSSIDWFTAPLKTICSQQLLCGQAGRHCLPPFVPRITGAVKWRSWRHNKLCSFTKMHFYRHTGYRITVLRVKRELLYCTFLRTNGPLNNRPGWYMTAHFSSLWPIWGLTTILPVGNVCFLFTWWPRWYSLYLRSVKNICKTANGL